jgi:hypothetical protein
VGDLTKKFWTGGATIEYYRDVRNLLTKVKQGASMRVTN